MLVPDQKPDDHVDSPSPPGNRESLVNVLRLRRVADAYVAKYGEGWRFAIHHGAFYPDTGSVPEGGEAGVLVFEVTPTKAFGFGRGELLAGGPWRADARYSQTRWRFQASPTATRTR